MEINPVTTDFSLDQQCFVFLYSYSLCLSQSTNQSISVPHKTIYSAVCQRWRAESGEACGRCSTAPDLNSICPHAKGMNTSEGEWHLAWDNHAHVQNIHIHTQSALNEKNLLTFQEIPSV